MSSQVFAITIVLAMVFLVSYVILLLQNNFVANEDSLVDKINSCLPQTQCAQCGYPGCKPYAQAINNNEVDINRCPPGGQATIQNLANLLNLETKPLAEDLSQSAIVPKVAKINEAECIGCLLCIKACPVDAIVGANKLMHTVITDQCTGCDLCVAPCPMSCISMVDQPLPMKYSYK